MSDRRIRAIEIDELVLDGPAGIDGAALGVSVERELARLADGARSTLVGRDVVRAEAPVPPSAGADSAGRAIAHAVLRGVRRA